MIAWENKFAMTNHSPEVLARIEVPEMMNIFYEASEHKPP
jgi:hypothetical protein